MNKVNINEEISRAKALMNYGLHTESKNTPYASIEFQKVGADGKVYGIIREGSKYYIKSAPKKKNLVREDFEYIGGFRNRKDNEYSSFANAEKQFDLKMMSLKESYANGKNIVVESWNPDKKENLSVEATDKMKKEILRERQIMHNAAMISEKKEISADIANTQKNNIKNLKHPAATGPKDSVFTEKATICPECGNSPCTCGKKGKKKKKARQECGVRESAEPLAWHKEGGDAHQNMADTYMDTSKGTEVGSSAPFDAAKGRNIDDDNKAEDTGEATNGVVEGRSMHYHYSNNQNMPKPGTGEGPSDEHNKPFNEDPNSGLDEAITGLGDDVEEGIDAEAGAGAGADAPVQEGDDAEDDGEEGFGPDVDGEEDYDDGSDEGELDDYDDGSDEDEDELDDFDDDEEDEDDTLDDIESDDDELESRVSNIEDLLGKIADKLGVSEFDDDSLYDDDDDDEESDDLYDDDDYDEGDGVDSDEDYDDGDELPESYTRNGYQIFESRAFRRAVKEDRLNDFGKHPAYQKRVMNLLPNNMQEFPGYYDMNDDSVDNDSPYGEKIGDGAPFSVDPDELEDAIVESIQRNLKKKSN